jgi:3-oxoadipate enol-lactonase
VPYLELPGARLYYEAAGAGPSLVFLHGVGSSAQTWDGQLRAFAGRFRCLAPDMRGYARSTVDDAATISMTRFALDVAALIEAENGAAHICGLSMGGIVAQHLWRARPELVRSLVLADTWANHPTAAAGQTGRLRAIDEGSMPDLAAARMPAVYGPAASPELVRRGIDVFASLDKSAYRAASADLWVQDVRDIATSITVPALVVVGEYDSITPPPLSQELAALIPGARLTVVPNAGHLTNEENQEAFDAALDGFLA